MELFLVTFVSPFVRGSNALEYGLIGYHMNKLKLVGVWNSRVSITSQDYRWTLYCIYERYHRYHRKAPLAVIKQTRISFLKSSVFGWYLHCVWMAFQHTGMGSPSYLMNNLINYRRITNPIPKSEFAEDRNTVEKAECWIPQVPFSNIEIEGLYSSLKPISTEWTEWPTWFPSDGTPTCIIHCSSTTPIFSYAGCMKRVWRA